MTLVLSPCIYYVRGFFVDNINKFVSFLTSFVFSALHKIDFERLYRYKNENKLIVKLIKLNSNGTKSKRIKRTTIKRLQHCS